MSEEQQQVEGCWPVEIVRCLECGAVSHTGCDWVGPCAGDDPMHGPTQSAPVLPAAVSSDLAEAFEHLIEAAGERSLVGYPEPKAALPKAKAALETYRNATGGSS